MNNDFLHRELHEEVFLKQASRNWFEKSRDVLLDLGFTQTLFDYSLFNELEMGIIKIQLENNFKLKDFGRLTYFIGIEISFQKKGFIYPKGNMF